MGASGWRHFVAYDADVDGALQRLRAQVFREGRYYRRGWLRRRLTGPPRTIEALVARNREEGTHSILDMTRARRDPGEPGFGEVAPLSEAELVELFGTARPTRAMVEEREHELMARQPRWSGTYVVVFDGDTPAELYFTGFSGD